MQYFKPAGAFFVGDCRPFFHAGIFHFIYLLDENHHQGKNGLGGHQWAHATSTDLKTWVYQPFASPPPGHSRHYRDPFVFEEKETGLFHLLVTAERENQQLPQSSGCLAHLTSPDLKAWTLVEPFLIPGYLDVPECPDYFEWNGWYYLIFSNYGVARYRMSRHALRPWLCPPVDTFDSAISRVLKSAAFGSRRRLGVAFLPTRRDGKNDGELLYAGNAIFREIIQLENGSLDTKFPPEMIPASGPVLDLRMRPLAPGVTISQEGLNIKAAEGFGAASFATVPFDFRLSFEVRAEPNTSCFGLLLRASGRYEKGCELRFYPQEQRIELGDQAISCVPELRQPFQVEIVVTADILGVCVAERRCLVQRAPESSGENLCFFCHNGEANFSAVEVRELLLAP